MDKEKLKKILADHLKWVRTDTQEGVRADLRGADLQKANLWGANLWGADLREANLRETNFRDADLREANLWEADLWGAVGNKREIKSLQIEDYDICYTKTILQIGCEAHEIEKWKNFSDTVIDKMDVKALEWWKEWKEFILKIIEMSPGE